MKRGALAVAAAAFLAAALFPAGAVVDALATRYHTAAGFRGEVLLGFQLLRGAVCLAAAFLAAVLLRPALFWPPVAPSAAPPAAWTSRERLFCAGAVLGALLLRLVGAGQSLQDDEWFYYIDYVKHGPLVVLGRSVDLNNQILSNLVASLVLRVVPFSEVAYRLPSILAGAFAVLPTFALLRRWGGPRAAVLGALILAVHPFAVGWSQEARSAGFIFLLAPAALLLYHRVREGGSHRAWIAYVAVQTLAVWANLLAAMFPAVLLALGLWERRTDRAFRARWLTAFAGIALASLVLYALHLAIWFRLLGRYGEEPVPLSGRFPRVWIEWTLWTLPALLRALPVAAAAVGLARLREPTSLLILSSLLFGAAVVAAPFPLPARYACFAFVPWIALLAAGADAGRGRAVLAWACLALFAADLAGSVSTGKLDTRWAAETVARLGRADDRVGFVTETVALEHYGPRLGLRPVRISKAVPEPPPWICLSDLTSARPWMAELLRSGGFERVAEKRAADGRSVEVWRRR